MGGKFFLIVIALFNFSFVFAQYKDKPVASAQSNSLLDLYVKFNIGNVTTFIYNNGGADISNTGDTGFKYPYSPTSYNGCVYESGLLWAGKVKGQIRSGGSCYNQGLIPGKILANGKPEDPSSNSVRPFKVRKDYKTSNLSQEIQDENKNYQTVFNQYEKDWNEWPASKGAPFTDINKNGIYEPSVDIPGFPGADQTIWFVANDQDSIRTKKLFGALPMGIEMQTTVWGYKDNYPLPNMVFKRYLIINKSNIKFDDMYIGIWSDPDLGGDAGDDLIGCDTLLNMVYDYNGDDTDPSFGAIIPAVGFVLLQGPVIPGNSNDFAIIKGKKINGKKNLKMTALSWVAKYPQPYSDPILGSYTGTIQLYNFLQGKLNDGTPFINPYTGNPTNFPFSGDPITKSGFIGGITYPDGSVDRKHDRRMMLCSGPFNMAVGDTQEIIFVELAAGGNQGYSRLAAIALLKQAAQFAHQFFGNNFFPPSTTNLVPNLKAVEMDREIILSWGDEINGIEKSNFSEYLFQGYNVYQISKNQNTLGEKTKIATFDIADEIKDVLEEKIDPAVGFSYYVVKQRGTDSGIQRFISINKDYLNDIPLNNGSDYDFAVSYYLVRKDVNFLFTSIESPAATISVIPQQSKPGFRYESKFGDIISTKHNSGSSLATVTAMIVDPTKVTGDEYEVTFTKINNQTVFSLRNVSKNNFLLINQTNLTGDNEYLITEGFILKVKNDLSNALTSKDVYRFNSPKTDSDNITAEQDFEKINVFPNPYYGSNRNEFSKYDRHVTFSHLPQRAIIRIFNLAGQIVQRFEKDSPDQFFRWNMLNKDNYQIPSGLYIVHIELPDFGKVKILKMAIFTEVFIPDRF